MSSAPTLDLTIVVPAYNEAKSLPLLCDRLREALAASNLRWELIIVDDGSSDDTFATVVSLHGRDERVHGLRLSRNFGHQLALLAGMQAARGAAVVTMDADLQHPPELIPALVERWRGGAAIVHAVRDDSEAKLPLFKRTSSRAFYWLFRKLTGLELRPGMADFRLFDRAVTEVITASGDHRPFFRGLAAWVGFPQASVPFRPGARLHGGSRYTLTKMLRLALSGVVGFSAAPLYWSLGVGAVGLVLSLSYAVYAFIAHFFLGTTMQGWTSIIALMSILMSIQFIMLGILGMYIGEISQAVRGRPSVVVAQATIPGVAVLGGAPR